MAFATSNVLAGNAGNRRTVTGVWTSSAGDAPGTISIGSANVTSYDFDPNVSSGSSEKPLVSASVSGATTTLSVYHHQTITAGKFRIEFV